MNRCGIEIDQEKLAEICRRHRIRKLSLFGSVLRDDFHPDSDVDVLVDFEPGYTTGLFGLANLEKELSSLLGGRKVDLILENAVNRWIRRQVLSEAEVRYVQEG